MVYRVYKQVIDKKTGKKKYISAGTFKTKEAAARKLDSLRSPGYIF